MVQATKKGAFKGPFFDGAQCIKLIQLFPKQLLMQEKSA